MNAIPNQRQSNRDGKRPLDIRKNSIIEDHDASYYGFPLHEHTQVNPAANRQRRNFCIIAILAFIITTCLGGGVIGIYTVIKAEPYIVPSLYYIPPDPQHIKQPVAAVCQFNFGAFFSWTGRRYTCMDHTDTSGSTVMALVAYSMQTCIDACESYNRVVGNRTCVAVSMDSDLRERYGKEGANCWLKSSVVRIGRRDGMFSSVDCDIGDCRKRYGYVRDGEVGVLLGEH
ncbi:hypothetical protein BDV96DRAFT_655532 [Lophiotrema nucula]|uniref:Apple domain-containing protein n=1 Tax=Lophiotrema nucula TaxID=690887 RepID=A0A6A5YE09_9PLEO|nr:hypothetical protein BDV96DRAFT_655532 [Lophiotrema nucula]